MLTVSVAISGARWAEVEARIKAQLEEVVRETAATIKDHAVAACPVRTGKLRDSIAVENDDPLHATVAVGEDYAPYVEFGTHKMAAQPFLTPAADLARAGFAADVERALREATAG